MKKDKDPGLLKDEDMHSPVKVLPGGKKLYETQVRTLIVGAGAAGLKAAVTLSGFGETDLLVAAEGLLSGTSRNTGSDKQTYYKLSLAGPEKDSVRAMAEDLFSGEAVDGEHALCEAALSARSFYHLADIGVPFPENEYGENIGYRTDHDLRGRASSAGPYTSKMMTEALYKEALSRGIRMKGGLQLIQIFTDKGELGGALFYWQEEKHTEKEARFLLVHCENLILATGGPAAIYRDSVYPQSQTGASGIAFQAGIRGRNLTEWQFGMASVSPRWNVSGSYMQVLPRFISTDPEGNDAREFLSDVYEDPELLLTHTFRKGYEWPFDVSKASGGSSLIDLFVFEETVVKKRRVFLDYRSNPEALSRGMLKEAARYLSAADALKETPILRLRALNEPAYQFYLSRGVDLTEEMLEIRISAQHNNGGLFVDAHWETNIRGIYAAGEAACTHGVRRPGGSALNAGQAGAYRAAEHIAFSGEKRKVKQREALSEEAVRFLTKLRFSAEDTPERLFKEAQGRMSAAGGMIRNRKDLMKALSETSALLDHFFENIPAGSNGKLSLYFRLYDVLTAQKVYLSAMLRYMEYGGGSRGSALYTDPEGLRPHKSLSDRYLFTEDAGKLKGLTQEILYENGTVRSFFREVRPMPDAGLFFESEWKKYRERRGG